MVFIFETRNQFFGVHLLLGLGIGGALASLRTASLNSMPLKFRGVDLDSFRDFFRRVEERLVFFAALMLTSYLVPTISQDGVEFHQIFQPLPPAQSDGLLVSQPFAVECGHCGDHSFTV